MEQIETFWNMNGSGEKMTETKEKRTEVEQVEQAEQIEQVEQVEPIAIYKNNIYALVDDVKQEPQFINKTDEELKQDKSFFPILVDYIYNSYIGELLGNKHGRQMVYKDVEQLDYLFNIYISLVYKYKWNNRPLIVEFSIFTGINKNTFYNWLNSYNSGEYNKTDRESILTPERSDIVQKWISVCERGLIDGSDTIKDIFILKAKYGFKEASNELNITVNHKNIISAEDLPALIDVENPPKR